MIYRRSMVGQKQRTMAVRKGNPSEVPEYKEESPFLMVHIPIFDQLERPLSARPPALPGRCDALFAFGAGVGVQEVRHH